MKRYRFTMAMLIFSLVSLAVPYLGHLMTGKPYNNNAGIAGLLFYTPITYLIEASVLWICRRGRARQERGSDSQPPR